MHRIIFDLGALYYDRVTAWLPDWREDCARIASFLRDDDRLILDLGCGPGVSAFETAASDPRRLVIGMDISHVMLRRAQKNRVRYPEIEKSVQLVQSDGQAVPLRSGSVDAVTTHSTFYLVSDRRAVLREMQRILKPGGQALLFEPRRERPAIPAWKVWRERPQFAWTMVVWGLASRFDGAFAEGELSQMMREAGFEIHFEKPALEGFAWLVTGRRSPDT